MKRDEIFPSKYLRASDLPQPRVVTISSATMEPLKNDGKDVDKLVLYFRERIKPLVVNLTIYESISVLYGDETDLWPDKRIEVHADRCRFGSKMVDCVRTREPAQASLPMAGNSTPPARPRPRAVAKPQPPAPEPPPADDNYDDSIPFE
jgi:hypothetical protein